MRNLKEGSIVRIKTALEISKTPGAVKSETISGTSSYIINGVHFHTGMHKYCDETATIVDTSDLNGITIFELKFNNPELGYSGHSFTEGMFALDYTEFKIMTIKVDTTFKNNKGKI